MNLSTKYVYLFNEGNKDMRNLLGARRQPGRDGERRAACAAGFYRHHRGLHPLL